MDIAINYFRWIAWLFTRLLLKIVDFLYDLILTFFGLNLNDFTIWRDGFRIVFTAMGLFIAFRIAVMIFRSFVDDSSMERLGNEFTGRLIQIALVLSLVPVGMPLLSRFASESAVLIPDILNYEDARPSEIVLYTGANANMTGDLSDKSSEVDLRSYIENAFQHRRDRVQENSDTINDDPNADDETRRLLEEARERAAQQYQLDLDKNPIDLLTVDIVNEKADGQYVVFADTSNIILMLIQAGLLAYCFVTISIQIISRLVGLIMKMIISPYVVSGIIDPNDQSIATWFKLCMGDFLAAYFQMFLLFVAMSMTTHLPDSWSATYKGFGFVGIIFSVLVAPNGIAQLLGQDIGGQQGLMMMQHARQIGNIAHMGGHLASNIGRRAVRSGTPAAVTGGAAGVYGVGRMLGGRTLNPQSQSGNTSGGGAVVRSDGILHYNDNKVSNLNAPRFRATKMTEMLGSFMYQQAARRVFNSPVQRATQRQQRSFGSNVSHLRNAADTIVNYDRNKKV